MFISQPSYRFQIPQGLSEPGCMYWQALDLPIRLPWFIATFERPDGDSTHLQTLCLWWTIDLLSLLNQVPEAKLRSLQCVCPHRNLDLHWQMRDVARVWQGIEPSSQQPELFFEDNEGAHFSAFHPDSADEFFTDHDLVIELPQPNRQTKKPRHSASPRQRRPTASTGEIT